MRNNDTGIKIVINLVILGIVLLCGLLATSVRDASEPVSYQDTNESEILKLMFYQGMPCIYAEGTDGVKYGAIDCNWDEWEGELDGEQFIFPTPIPSRTPKPYATRPCVDEWNPSEGGYVVCK